MPDLKSIKELAGVDLESKRVLVRVDYNVPLDGDRITDDTRIRATLPTLKYLIDHKAKVILMSHLGRPKGKANPDYSLLPVSKRLNELLGQTVLFASDCVGDSAQECVGELEAGRVCLLENLRFHTQETDNDPAFSKQLASLADLFIQDAFGVVHRSHASTVGVTEYLPSYMGLLVDKEIQFLDHAIQQPKRPFVAIVGGAKVSSKIGVLKALLGKVDTLVIGGAMAYTFLYLLGHKIGDSMLDKENLEIAESFWTTAQDSKTTILLPTDHVVADAFKPDAKTQITSDENVPEGWMALDVGPKTTKEIETILNDAQTVLWNGPLGVFEMPAFAKATLAVAHALGKSSGISIVGGGDSVAAITQSGETENITHISTGGGASLAFLEGQPLPGLEAIKGLAYDG